MKNSTEFKVGSRVKCRELGHRGVVKALHPAGRFLMILRDDKVRGTAWDDTEFEGCWAIRLVNAEKIKSLCLTNK